MKNNGEKNLLICRLFSLNAQSLNSNEENNNNIKLNEIININTSIDNEQLNNINLSNIHSYKYFSNDDINMSLVQNKNELKNQISFEISNISNENKVKDIVNVEKSFKKSFPLETSQPVSVKFRFVFIHNPLI